MNKRRVFLINSLVGAGAALAAIAVNAATEKSATTSNPSVKTLDEKSSKAVGLAYVSQSKIKDKSCSNCALYTPSGDKAGKCGIFPGELVAAAGWCQAYNKKA